MTTDNNDGKKLPEVQQRVVVPERIYECTNEQMVGRLSPFIEPGHVNWLHGMDSVGMPYRDYEITPPDMQSGDAHRRTLIDIRNRTVNHIAVVMRNKQEASGSLVAYVFSASGTFIHRIPASDEIVRTEVRRSAQSYAEGDLNSLTLSVLELGQRMNPQPDTLLAETVAKRGGEVYAIGSTPKEVVVNAAALSMLEIFKPAGMTLEEAAVINGIASPEDKVRTLEKWINTHGGMDRINEATLSRALFGPAPGSQERAQQADMETAQRLCRIMVINEINYGRLAVSHLGGIPFVGDVDDLGELGLPAVHISRVPKFNTDIKLLVHWKVGEQENCTPFYALEKEDINELGVLLSNRGTRVAAHFMAADLKVWVNGVVEREYTSPEEFFACKPEWIEKAKF